MARDKTARDIEDANKQMSAASEGDASRRKGEAHTATTPAAGAAVHHARVGAELSAENRERQGETADAIKRAAENDGRV
jgi:hypothetical protein